MPKAVEVTRESRKLRIDDPYNFHSHISIGSVNEGGKLVGSSSTHVLDVTSVQCPVT